MIPKSLCYLIMHLQSSGPKIFSGSPSQSLDSKKNVRNKITMLPRLPNLAQHRIARHTDTASLGIFENPDLRTRHETFRNRVTNIVRRKRQRNAATVLGKARRAAHGQDLYNFSTAYANDKSFMYLHTKLEEYLKKKTFPRTQIIQPAPP